MGELRRASQTVSSGRAHGLCYHVSPALNALPKKLGEWVSSDKKAMKFNSTKGFTMLWTIIVILVVLWLLGFIGHIGGGLIHLLLVIAVIVLIINLIQGRRGV